MTYIKQFELIEETRKQLKTTANEKDQVSLHHRRPGGNRFWPSAVSFSYPQTSRGCTYDVVEGACLRNSYYRMTGQSTTDFPDPKMYDIWEIGNSVEDMYVDRFRALNEYRIIFPTLSNDKLKFSNPDTGLSGEADIIIQHKETGVYIGVEMKSYYGFWSCLEIAGYEVAKAAYGAAGVYLRNDEPQKTAPGKPKTQNLLQTMLYLEEFWDSPVMPIRIFKIIYIPRDKGITIEFDITLADYKGKRCAQVNGVIFPEYNLEAIHARYDKLESHIKDGKLPPRDYITEYNADYMLTNSLPLNMNVWHKVLHMDWKDAVNKKANAAKSKPAKKRILDAAQVDIKRDWHCEYCPYLSRCQQDTKQEGVF